MFQVCTLVNVLGMILTLYNVDYIRICRIYRRYDLSLVRSLARVGAKKRRVVGAGIAAAVRPEIPFGRQASQFVQVVLVARRDAQKFDRKCAAGTRGDKALQRT